MEQTFILPSKMHLPTISNYYIENLFRVLFDPQTKITRRDLFSTYNSVRKEQKIIQEIIKRSQNFDWMSIFDFLKKQNIKEGHQVLLEEIIFKCLRVNPAKTFEIISRPQISEILWKHSLHHSIFRIIYVVVFVQWHKGNLQKLKEKQKQTLLSMLSDLCRLPQLVFQTKKQANLDSNGDESLKFRISLNIEHMLMEFLKLIKIFPPVIISQLLNILHIKQLISTFHTGLQRLHKINQKRYSQLLQQQQDQIDNIEQFLEGIADTLISTIKIIFHQSSIKYLQLLPTSQYHTQIRRKIFQQILDLQDAIQKYLTIQIFTKTASPNNQQISNIGLFRFKLIKLQISILDQISHFVYKQETQHSILLVGKIGVNQISFKIPKLDPLNIIKIYLPINRWNNIFQLELLKLVDKTLSFENYFTFFKRIYIVKQKQDNSQISSSLRIFSDTFLGILVSQFRNKNFIYLSSLRFTSNGNIQTIYKISQLLLLKCKRQDKAFLMEKYHHLKHFFKQDLSKYSDYLFSNRERYFLGAKTSETQNNVLQSIKDIVQSDHTISSNRSLLSIIQMPEPTGKYNSQKCQTTPSNENKPLGSIKKIKKKQRNQCLIQSNFIKRLQGLVSDGSAATHKIIN